MRERLLILAVGGSHDVDVPRPLVRAAIEAMYVALSGVPSLDARAWADLVVLRHWPVVAIVIDIMPRRPVAQHNGLCNPPESELCATGRPGAAPVVVSKSQLALAPELGLGLGLGQGVG